MKFKHYLITILLPVLMIFGFSVSASAQDVEEPITKTEAKVEIGGTDKKESETEEKNTKAIKTEDEKPTTSQKDVDTTSASGTEKSEEKTSEVAAKSEDSEAKSIGTALEKETSKQESSEPEKKNSSYTVEFTHKDLQYVLPGGTSVKLAKILEKLEIKGNDPTEVECSDSDLFSATKEGGEWVITSHKAFRTDEHLYVTVDNTKYNIKVTDEVTPPSGWARNDSYSWKTSSSLGGNNIYAIYYYDGSKRGLLTFTGSGVVSDVTESNSILSKTFDGTKSGNILSNYSVTHVEIPDAITELGNNMFCGVNRTSAGNVKNGFTVHFGTGVQAIGKYTFQASGITAAYLPDSVTTIWDQAFDYCPLLTNVLIPASLNSGGSNAIRTKAFNSTPNGCNFYVSSYCGNLSGICNSNVTDRFGNYANQKFHWHGSRIGNDMYAFSETASEPTGHPGNYSTDASNSNRKVLEIVGYGSMYNYNTSNNLPPWSSFKGNFTSINFNTVFGNKNVDSYDRNFTSIGDYAFYQCSNVTSVILPADLSSSSSLGYRLTSIGQGAFEQCTKLTSIKPSGSSANTFPSGVETLSESVLNRCTSLASFTIPANVQTIGVNAFYGDTSLTAINIPNKVTTIGNAAFYGCTKLASVTINESTSGQTIGYEAFRNCTALTSITIPKSVTQIYGVDSNISRGAFSGCTALTSINFSTGRTYNLVLGSGAFYNTRATSITLPDKLITIGPGAFLNNINLMEVIIPNTVTTSGMKQNAFSTLAANASIYYTGIGTNTGNPRVNPENEFVDKCDTSVENVFGTGNTLERANKNGYHFYFKCGDYLWYTADSYNSTGDTASTEGGKITISGSGDMWGYHYNNNPGGNAPYGLSPFNAHCQSNNRFKTIVIQSGTTSIGRYAFFNCTPVENITLTTGITSVGNGAFEGCTSLTSIKPSNATSGPNTLPSSVNTLNESVFFNCSSLETFTIQNTVTTIGNGAFKQSGLTSIIIPNSVTSVSTQAFYNCSKLASVTIPDSINTGGLDANAFAGLGGDSSVTQVDIYYKGNETEFSDKCNTSIENVFGSGNTIDRTSSSSYYYHFPCGNTLWYTLDSYNDGTANNGIIIITGSGEMANYNTTSDISPFAAHFSSGSSYKNVDMQNGSTIGSAAFYNCVSLTTVTLDSSALYATGGRAFEGCTSLTTIGPSGSSVNTFPNTVTFLANYVFYGCTSLTSFTISGVIDSIGEYAFYGDTALTGITIPTNVTSIGSNAFRGCTGLANITITDGRTTELNIGSEAFRGTDGGDALVGTLTIPANVTIGQAAFSHSDNRFTTIDLSAMNKSIGHTAFLGDAGVSEVYLGSGITSIGGRVFTDATTFWYKYGTKADLISKMINESSQQSATTITQDGYSFTNLNHVFHFLKSGGESTDKCGDNLYWKVEYDYESLDNNTPSNTTMYITGYGDFYTTYTKNNRPWTNNVDGENTITKAVITKTVAGGADITKIGDAIFRKLTALTTVEMPNTITEIRHDAFWLCTSLANVTLPSSLEIIGPGAFNSCAFTSIDIPASVTEISDPTNTSQPSWGGFSNCPNLSSVNFASNPSITTIGVGAFYGCSQLASVTIPTTISSAGMHTNAFAGLKAKADIYYNDSESEFTTKCATSVTNVFGYDIESTAENSYIYHFPCGNTLWYGVDGYNNKITITGSGTMTNYNNSSGGNSVFRLHCLSSKPFTTIDMQNGTSIGDYAFYNCNAITNVIVHSSSGSSALTSVGQGAFWGCSSLASIKTSDAPSGPNTLPDTVTALPTGVFRQCTSLTSFTIPSDVTTIGSIAFYSDSSLTEIEIPNKVTSVGGQAFYYCSKLSRITIPTSINTGGLAAKAFERVGEDESVPKVDVYYNGPESEFTPKCATSVTNVFGYDIESAAENSYIYHFKCGDNLWYSIDGYSKNTDITGTGPMWNYNNTDNISPFKTHDSVIKTVDMSTATGTNASKLTVGAYAFYQCATLESINLPTNTYYQVSGNAFEESGIKSITLPNSLNWSSGYNIFKNCTRLETAVINVGRIYSSSFAGCTALTNLTLSDSVTRMESTTFDGCSKLASVTIPTSITITGGNNFRNIGTDSSISQVDIYYNGEQSTLESKCSGGSITYSFGFAVINDGKYAFHFTQSIAYYSDGSEITGEGVSPTSYQTASGNTVTLYTPQDASRQFEGWCTDEQLTSEPITSFTAAKNAPYGNLVYYAKWVTERAIHYIVNGGNTLPDGSFQPMTGETITLATPTRNSYAFLGWHFLENLTDDPVGSFVADSSHNDDVTVYAQWHQRTNITYWTDSSQTLSSTTAYEIVKPWETKLGTEGGTTWYVLNSNTTFSKRLIVNGTVNLILEDGCTLTAPKGISVNNGNNINIYAQDSDYNYINQNLGNILKMNFNEVPYIQESLKTTYGSSDPNEDVIADLSTGKRYEQAEYSTMDYYYDTTGGIATVITDDQWVVKSTGDRYYTPDKGKTKYYEDQDSGGYYISTRDAGATKYYLTNGNVTRWDNPNKATDKVWTVDDHWTDCTDSPYHFDTIGKKLYNQYYDSENDQYYYCEINDTAKAHKYYPMEDNSQYFAEDWTAYNNAKKPGALNAGAQIDREGAGIGGDEKHINGNITIYGGKLNIQSYYDHAAIGTGRFSEDDTVPANNSNITINGGTLTVHENSGQGATIGGGTYANGGHITVTGGRLILNNGWAGSSIGAGNGVSQNDNTTTISLSWTNLTDYIVIQKNNINYAEGGLTLSDQKQFVFAFENRITNNSYASAETIAAKGENKFKLVPYASNARYLLRIPNKVVLPFKTSDRKISYDPDPTHEAPTVSVQTQPDDKSTPDIDESTPLIRPYRIILTMTKVDFKRVIGKNNDDTPIFDNDHVIAYSLLDENNTNLNGVDKYFSSTNYYDYDNHRITHLNGSENAWINIDSSQWTTLVPGIYQGSLTFDVDLATNGEISTDNNYD